MPKVNTKECPRPAYLLIFYLLSGRISGSDNRVSLWGRWLLIHPQPDVVRHWGRNQWRAEVFTNFKFYAPEAHIMYLTVVSWFLISFVMRGSGPSRAIKLLYAPAPPPPSVWTLKPPWWALVHKTNDAPIIYKALCIMFWMCAYPLLGQVGGGWAQEILIFLGPKWRSPIDSMPFHKAQKTL